MQNNIIEDLTKTSELIHIFVPLGLIKGSFIYFHQYHMFDYVVG